MLDRRAIALDGIGSPLPLLARDGLWPVEEEPPVDELQTVYPGVTYWPRRKRSTRARREEELLLFIVRR
jgi:hypothetical protein